MTKPKIVGEEKREIKVVPPPTHIKMEWLDIREWSTPEDIVDVYIAKSAIEKILKHCTKYAKDELEVMGLLIGDVYRWKRKIYTVVDDIVTTELDATTISVKFKKSSLGELAKVLDSIEYDYIIVGWYHSHPGFTSFISDKDIETQSRIFNRPYHVSIVVDPILKEMKAFKFEKNSFYETHFVIFRDEDRKRPLSKEYTRKILEYIDYVVKKQIYPKLPQKYIPKPEKKKEELPDEVLQYIAEDIKKIAGKKKKDKDV
ncbi:MAG: hypothetical protein AB1779_03405 [Candidatus Thermoplasmatota archaeon]